MKVIVIGAGNAGLVAAEKLARGGLDVSVFEKNAYKNLSYDWHDDVNAAAFTENNLPMPKEGTYFTKKNWSFIPPAERVEVTLHILEEKLDLSTERRSLAQQYVDRADGVDFHFSSPVDSLIIKENKVVGITSGGKEYFADLVIDNSGALSPFRASLPKEWGITAMPDKSEIFVAYRGFHKKLAGVSDPENSNRAYLKHLGKDGISWSILDPAGTVNVLIGRQGELTDEAFEEAYSALKASNPEISDEVVRGGFKCVIPIRYPLSKMVWDGYVALGDSAFMTIPMIGSGIENGMKAAVELADVILKTKSSKKEDLWAYEVTYYKKRGADHVGVDVLKRWLLAAKPSDLDWLFEKGVVDEKNMADAATGHLIVLSFPELLQKVKRGFTRLSLLLRMNDMLMRAKRAAALGRKIPSSYDEDKISSWRAKIEKTVYGK